MRHFSLALVVLLLSASCKTLDDHYPEVANPVSAVMATGTVVVHDRSVINGGNFLDVTEVPPKAKAAPSNDPNRITLETNVVLLKRGTMFTAEPFELLVEGSLEGRVSGDITLDFRYELQSFPGNYKISTVRLPWVGAIERISWTDLNDYGTIPTSVQEGTIADNQFQIVLTRSMPFHEDPVVRWTWGLVVLPFAELLTATSSLSATTVALDSGFVSPNQRLQLVGEDGTVWGELEGDTYRVFDSEAAPPVDDVIRVLATVRLEVWMFKKLTTGKAPKTRNVRYLP